MPVSMGMSTEFAPLAERPWRRGTLMDVMPTGAAQELTGWGRPVQFDIGETLVEQGAARPSVFVVTGGVVKATRTALPDSAPMLVAVHVAGDVLGTTDALVDRAAHLTYTAAKRTSVLVVSRAVFGKLIRHNAELTRALCMESARQLQLRDRSLAYASLDVESRLAAFLDLQRGLRGTRTAEGWVHVDLGLTQADLAAAIGASQPSVNKIMTRWQEEGRISIGYRTVFVKRRLASWSDDPAGEE